MTQGGDANDEADSFLRAVASAPERVPEVTPTRVAHFRIVGRLGRGGMGVVYRAEDEMLRRIVALKVLLDTSSEEERRQRFLREARSAAAISHGNVATVYQVGEAEGQVYIAIELVEGENLRQRLNRERLPLAIAKDLAAQIARGLAAAHDKGIVHRDLKPENVMITPLGVVKLLDFGLAKASVGEGAAAQAETETLVTSDAGRIMGTPHYMSPEQATGAPVDVRSDVFAFGSLFYEMLSGTRAFGGTTVGEILVAIARDTPAPLRSKTPGLDEATEAIVMKCLAKAPGDRFANAGEIVAAMSTLASSRVDVEPITRGPMVPRRPVGRSVLAVVLAVGLVGAAAWRIPRKAATPPVATSATASRPEGGAEAWNGLRAHGGSKPHTQNAEAATLYDEAMHANGGEANRALLRRALALDPHFAAAHLALAIGASSATEAREHVAAAKLESSSFDEYDRRLLNLVELSLQDGVSPDEVVKAANALADALPDELDAQLSAALTLVSVDRCPEALRLVDRASRIGPDVVQVVNTRAQCLLATGDLAGAKAAADRCVALAPTNDSCLRRGAEANSLLGQCDAMEKDARRVLESAPASLEGHQMLFAALAAQGAPVEALRQVAKAMEDAHQDANEKRREVLDDELFLATYVGDLRAAEQSALAKMKVESADPDLAEGAHQAHSGLAALYEEEGNLARAAGVADDFMHQLPAWTLDHGGAMWNRIGLLDVLRRAGRISEADARARERAWLIDEQPNETPQALAAANWWVEHGSAATAQEARAALNALPGNGPPEDIWSKRSMGHLYLLAGDVAQALPRLRAYVAWCGSSVEVLDRMKARLWLGQALEQTSDRDGACAQYAAILARWGHAKPRSVTADEARAHATKLGCAL